MLWMGQSCHGLLTLHAVIYTPQRQKLVTHSSLSNLFSRPVRIHFLPSSFKWRIWLAISAKFSWKQSQHLFDQKPVLVLFLQGETDKNESLDSSESTAVPQKETALMETVSSEKVLLKMTENMFYYQS